MEKFILGSATFGSGFGSNIALWGQGESESEAFSIMNKAWDLGIRHFDTADAYGGGSSETMIGKLDQTHWEPTNYNHQNL